MRMQTVDFPVDANEPPNAEGAAPGWSRLSAHQWDAKAIWSEVNA